MTIPFHSIVTHRVITKSNLLFFSVFPVLLSEGKTFLRNPDVFWPDRPHKKVLCSGLRNNPEVKKMKKKKWCYWCPVRLTYPGVLEACDGPCPKEAYVEIDD